MRAFAWGMAVGGWLTYATLRWAFWRHDRVQQFDGTPDA